MRTRILAFVLACGACRTPVTQAPLDRTSRVETAASVHYALPSCPLAYEVLIREKSAMDGRPQFDTERFMALNATVLNGRMRLAGSVVGRSLHNGVRDHGKPMTTYAPVLLETDGLGWTERDGPTWLFSNVGQPGGLAWFFPTLPAATKPGATAIWNVPYESSNAGLRTEAKRGAGLVMPDDEDQPVTPTTFTRAEVHFESSHVEAGVRVAEYSITAEKHDASAPDDPFVATTEQTCRGTYEVTAAGRVLRAHIESTRTNTTKHVSAPRAQTFVDTADAQMNLVRACDGPVAPSLEPVLTPEEAAKPSSDQIRIEVGH